MRLAVALLSFIVATPLAAQNEARIETVPVAPGIHMLLGNGGNIGVSSGPDGVFLIDDQYAPVTERVLAAIRAFSDGPIRFVLNTHWHGDHTGGNENLGRAGALIVAHDNVRVRMSAEQFLEAIDRRVAPSPDGALPVVTFSETVTFYLNGDVLHVFHVPHAHTDGDVIIHWQRANVVHMGDTFFSSTYPFIDYSTGGTIDGMIAAADTVLALANADTKIIPGHGPLSDVTRLRTYRRMLATTRDRVAAALGRGQTLEQIQAAGLTSEWDEEWGQGYTTPARFIASVVRTIPRRPEP